jgi:hypothetical protein
LKRNQRGYLSKKTKKKKNKRGYKRYSNSNIGAASRKLYESNVKKNNPHPIIPIFSKSTFLRIHTPLIEKTYLTKNISNYI